jgi:hypothetical protein
MNKGFAVLESQFLCVIRSTTQCISIRFSLLKPASEYVCDLLDIFAFAQFLHSHKLFNTTFQFCPFSRFHSVPSLS